MSRRLLSLARYRGFSTNANPQPARRSPLPYYLLGAAAASGAAYYYLTTRPSPKPQNPTTTTNLSALPKLSNNPTVVFVLGGPGAGKGTQCANVVRDYGFVHLSAGDLLREERNRPGSPYGDLINMYIREGKIVPMEITIALLHEAMRKNGGTRFLVDGFPRALDQALKFEEVVCESKFVLYFECPEEEMLKRLLKRGECDFNKKNTSGRVDDNIESIKKRFVTFRDTSYPVIEYYAQRGKVRSVSCVNDVNGVYRETKKHFEQMK